MKVKFFFKKKGRSKKMTVAAKLPLPQLLRSNFWGIGAALQLQQQRGLFGLSLGKKGNGRSSANETIFKDRKFIGYTPQQVYDVVSNISEYKQFVPFCTESKVLLKTEKYLIAKLSVGIGAITETYTSTVTLQKPDFVYAVASNSLLFNTLENNWRFASTPNGGTQVDFSISFEFRSVFYSQVAGLLFKEMVPKMTDAFIERCRLVYGPPKI